MSSIISGFEYDIFISYRHNDNKYDGWVTQFISNLRMELTATMKAKLDLYHDEHPKDGLLETSDVDASLSPKVRALIFIPILSQTYCDPESFAWKDEFLPFIKMAVGDRFGATVKLPNGNVTNRVLPVLIHTIDQEDVALFERSLGAALRPIEFIYKSTGVNRPLRMQDDELKANPNQAIYRDQINKVANAVRGIVLALKNIDDGSEVIRSPAGQTKTFPSEDGAKTMSRRRLFYIGGVVAVLVIFLTLVAYYVSRKREGVTERSIAVLPFSNLSSNPELDYFGDGIVDDILDQLTKISDLKVRNRTSTLQYRSSSKNIQEIGKELNVDAIVEGSVRKFENSYRVVIQLIDVKTGDHLGKSLTYDLNGKDILNIQTEVSTAAAAALRSNMAGTGLSVSKRSQNPEAYKLYLKGRFYWNLRLGKYMVKGVKAFQDAIEQDPSYASAYAGLADCYTALGYISALSPEESFPKARTAANRAIELDPTLAEPHCSLGYIKFYYDWDWAGAEKEFKTAIALDPKYAISYEWYGWYLTSRERFSEATRVLKIAAKLDSLSAAISTDMAFSLYYGSNLEKAKIQLKASLALNDSLPLTHLIIGRIDQDQNRFEEAIEEYNRTLQYAPNWAVGIAALGNLYGAQGKPAKAREMLAKLDTLRKHKKFVTSYGVALIYSGLNRKDEAFEWLRNAYLERSHWLVWLKLDPRWKNIREDKRFAELVTKVNL
jgi:TolB-like protein/Tfp pilus assembly protein PilF